MPSPLVTPLTMMSVAWPSRRGPRTTSVTLATASTSTPTSRRRLAAEDRAEPTDRGAEVLAPLGRHADAAAGPEAATPRRRARWWSRTSWSSSAAVVPGRAVAVAVAHAAAPSPSCDATISAYVGQVSMSSSCVPRPIELAVVEHEDLVGVGDRRHALGDDQHGGLFGVRVRAPRAGGRRSRGRAPRTSRRTRRSRVGDERAGDRQPLALAARHVRCRPARSRCRARPASPARNRPPGRSRAPPTARRRWRPAARSAGWRRRCPRTGTAFCGT